MKPLLAADRLRRIAARLAAGEPLDELQRAWLGLAFVRRLSDPAADLDGLLGLRSRQGGRLGACSQQPARDQALRELAGEAGTVKDRAIELQDRIRAWQNGASDEALDNIARRYGDPPLSLRQLQRIVAGTTEAARLTADDGNLASDMSSRPMTARWQHHPTRGPCNEPEHPHHAR
jgi:hypothetical protein